MPTYREEEITPAIARQWLRKNFKNRKPKMQHIQALARDIDAGRYALNGSAICFDTNGALMNGQHRLQAVVFADKPIRSLVVRGLDPVVMTTIDETAPRSAADAFQINETRNANKVAATLRAMTSYARGVDTHSLSTAEVVELLDRFPEAKTIITLPGALSVLSTAVSAIHAINRYLGKEEKSQEFVDVLMTGIPTYPGDAAHTFRERIIRESLRTNNKLGRVALLRAAAHAWNMFEKQVSMKKFPLPSDKTYINGWTTADLGLDVDSIKVSRSALIMPDTPETVRGKIATAQKDKRQGNLPL